MRQSLSHKMDAKSPELRITMSLVRLLDHQGHRTEARAVLAEIYNWFTDGFDTPDPNDAKASLDSSVNEVINQRAHQSCSCSSLVSAIAKRSISSFAQMPLSISSRSSAERKRS